MKSIMSEPTHTKGSRPAESLELIDDQALDWFVLMSSGTPTAEQQVRFQGWLTADPRHQAAYDELDTLHADIDGLRHVFAPPVKQAAKPPRANAQVDVGQERPGSVAPLPEHRPSRSRRSTKNLWMGGLAACFALFVFNLPQLMPGLLADYHTAVGARAKIDLPDGSVAWLNTDSAIDVNYSEDRRQVVLLRGEAQFEVAKIPGRPFSVNASGGRSTALGTVYAVRKEGDDVVVTVTEGTVEVVSPLPDSVSADQALSRSRVVLTRDQQVRYHEGEPPGQMAEGNSKAQLAWRQGFIDIRDRPLAEALAEINRYYPGRIVLLADTGKLQPVTARLSIASVANGLDALVSTQGLKVTRLTDYLVLVR
ncbi:MAG: FecR family protein [Pseudomonas sp.]